MLWSDVCVQFIRQQQQQPLHRISYDDDDDDDDVMTRDPSDEQVSSSTACLPTVLHQTLCSAACHGPSITATNWCLGFCLTSVLYYSTSDRAPIENFVHVTSAVKWRVMSTWMSFVLCASYTIHTCYSKAWRKPRSLCHGVHNCVKYWLFQSTFINLLCNKFAIKWSSKTPSHRKRVTTIPCEI